LGSGRPYVMLALEVARMREGSGRLEQTIPAQALAAEDEYRVTSPVALEAATNKDKEKVRIAGRIKTTIELVCSRCLEPFTVPVDAAFDLLYLPAAEAPGDEEVEVAEEDINTAFYRDGVIDLAELVHEQLYLALPMKPLCRDDCKGLCPVCGVNRNSTTCTCDVRWEDPRLAGLKALFKDNDHA
jgi:uncharacterized protein